MSQRYFEEKKHAEIYAKYRPHLIPAVIPTLLNFVKRKAKGTLKDAADIGCGSGQSTDTLATYFPKVTGVDVSQAQISQAEVMNKLSNVKYMVGPAENLPFEDNSLQLVMASEACHWFDLPKFFAEVDRCLVSGGVVALCGYVFPRPIWKDKNKELFNIVYEVYRNDLGEFWTQGLALLYDEYKDISIPYADFQRVNDIVFESQMTVYEFVQYMTSIAGYQQYQKHYGEDAALALGKKLCDRIMETIGVNTSPQETTINTQYPIFLLLGSKP